jgi:hypothetical protein
MSRDVLGRIAVKRETYRTIALYVDFPVGGKPAIRAWMKAAPGIWWAKDRVVAALLEPASRGERSGRRLDSSLEHAMEWPKVAGLFGVLVQDKYYEVPRGRVMLEGKEGHAVILHGNGTDVVALLQIARAFNLTKWTEEMDEHYFVGEEADRLFDLSESKGSEDL